MGNCDILTPVFIYGESNRSKKKIGRGPDFHLQINSMSLDPKEQPVLGRNFVQCGLEIIQCVLCQEKQSCSLSAAGFLST